MIATKSKKPNAIPSVAKTASQLETLARKYKDLFGQSEQREKEFCRAEKEVEKAQAKCLGIGRQSALDRWHAGAILEEVVQIVDGSSYPGGFKSWCAAQEIAYSTARQAKDLHKNLSEEQVRGLTITEAVKQSAKITAAKAPAKPKNKLVKGANSSAAAKVGDATKASANNEAGEVLDSGTGNIAANGKTKSNVSAAITIVQSPQQGVDRSVDAGAGDRPSAPRSVHGELTEVGQRLKAIRGLAIEHDLFDPADRATIELVIESCIAMLEEIKAAAQTRCDIAPILLPRSATNIDTNMIW
jgi:hypothetical protein